MATPTTPVGAAQATPATAKAGGKPKSWYIPAFDGLRGWLATLVMLGHAGFPSNVLWLALPIFFAMSGFFVTKILITHPSAGKVAGIRAFLRNRGLRILPIYVVFVLFLTALGIVGRPASVRGDLVWLWTAAYDIRIAMVGWNADLYSHTWSIAVEVQLYILMAVAALVLSRRGLRAFLVVLAVGGPLIRLAAVLALMSSGHSYAYVIEVLQALPFAYVDGFAMGGLLAFPELFRRLPSTRRIWLGFFALVAVVSVIEVVAAWRTGAPFPLWNAWAISFPIDYGWLWGYTLLGLCSVALIVSITRRPPRTTRVLESRAFVWLGERSYSIYLLHVPIFVLGHHIVGPDPTPLEMLAIFLVCGPLAVGVSTVTFRYIELPFQRRKTPRPVAAAAQPA